jgi:hypothetical protein
MLLMTMANMAALTGNYYAGLSDANQQRIGMATSGVTLLVSIFGPMILAKNYAVGARWGVIGLLLCFATYAAFILPAFLASLPVYWALLGPTGYLVLFGVLYHRRRRHLAAMHQTDEALNRFD